MPNGPPEIRLSARTAAAEATAAAALALVQLWPAWHIQHAASIALEMEHDEDQAAAMIDHLGDLTPPDVEQVRVAWETMDAAVRAWSGHCYGRPAAPPDPPPTIRRPQIRVVAGGRPV